MTKIFGIARAYSDIQLIGQIVRALTIHRVPLFPVERLKRHLRDAIVSRDVDVVALIR